MFINKFLWLKTVKCVVYKKSKNFINFLQILHVTKKDLRVLEADVAA